MPSVAPPAHLARSAPPVIPYAHPGLLAKRKVGWIWQFLIAGYSTFGRSFAYIGVRPIFIGEVYLGLSILANRGKWLNRFIDGVLRLDVLPVMIMLTALWGVFEVARPVLAGDSVVSAFRTCAFNYYPIFIMIGLAIGRGLLLWDFVQFWKRFALFYALYGLAFTVLSSQDIVAPWARGAGIPLFSDPALAPLVPVGMLAMWPLLSNWSLRWVVFPVSMVPMFYASGRGTILGFLLGLSVVACGSLKRFTFVGGTTATLLILMLIVGPMIKGASDRAETLDPTINFARIIATFDEDMAIKMLQRRGYHGAAEEMAIAKGTASWRKTIWMNAINSLNDTWKLALGHGHGTSVQDLTPSGEEIHTPHNFVIYAIYYTGVIGLVIFGCMILAVFGSSYYIPDPSVRLLQMSHVAMMCMVALVGNMFETPIAAVPFYLLSGVCLGLEAGMPKRYL